ncbi:hypothetical protein [Sphingomonas sp. PP-CE-1A-559]|uniref:hypothetical protein n=1 Tax=Sphingomonas sp. PP-CE-1A-559 TaxID=2135657 RepID=UPI001056C42E|nr:hypothetical protein [Sphingomonas sp. PP-CE-1A-559]
MTTSEQQAAPVAQEQESALATAFYLLDALAGEGLSQTCDDGRTIEADDTVHALCSAFYMEPDVGWYRDLAAELAPVPLPCKSGEGAGEDKGNHDCLAKRRPGEPMFILLGRDPDAWQIVRAWAARRLNAGGDPEHSMQGMKTANAMREYAADPANRPASAPDASAYPRLDATQTREAELVAALSGLELTEDGYSLRVSYDGDAADDGRAIVVGGETVVTFTDSDEGEAVREAILKIMGKSA